MHNYIPNNAFVWKLMEVSHALQVKESQNDEANDKIWKSNSGTHGLTGP